MNKEKRAELLMDHYKDTFQHILVHWKTRNRLFVFALIIIALMALDLVSPGSLSKLVNGYIERSVNNPPTFDFDVIGSAAWFLLLSIVIQYYQRSISVDRQYKYIHKLEEQICEDMGGDLVTREGKSYFSKTGAADKPGKQPLFTRAVGPIYVYFFPLFLISFVIMKVVHENLWPEKATDYFNIVVGLSIISYNIFYVLWVKFRR